MPGMTAEPFVDYRAKILDVPRGQQANIMGRSNLALVESGLVDWSDVVSSTRIRSLREVVSRKKLTVNQMTAAGVTRGRAESAWQAVHTNTHEAKEVRRQQLVSKLLNKGFSRQQILDAAGRSIGSRISIGEGPSGASSIPMVPFVTPGPKAKAAIAKQAALKPKGDASNALTQIQADKSGRLKLTADGMKNFLGGIIKGLKQKFGLDVKPVADMSAAKPVPAKPATPAKPVGFREWGKDKKGADAWGREAFSDWNGKITKEERKALKEYTSESRHINAVVRGLAKSDPETDKHIGMIDSALARGSLPQPTSFYRGVALQGLADMGITDVASLRPGTMVSNTGYLSTSLNPQVAAKFRGPGAIIKIQAPAGTKGGYMNAGSISSHKEENEFLMDRSVRRFRVVRVDKIEVAGNFGPEQADQIVMEIVP